MFFLGLHHSRATRSSLFCSEFPRSRCSAKLLNFFSRFVSGQAKYGGQGFPPSRSSPNGRYFLGGGGAESTKVSHNSSTRVSSPGLPPQFMFMILHASTLAELGVECTPILSAAWKGAASIFCQMPHRPLKNQMSPKTREPPIRPQACREPQLDSPIRPTNDPPHSAPTSFLSPYAPTTSGVLSPCRRGTPKHFVGIRRTLYIVASILAKPPLFSLLRFDPLDLAIKLSPIKEPIVLQAGWTTGWNNGLWTRHQVL